MIPPGFTSRRVPVLGTELATIEGGAGEPVVLVAGWPQSLLCWHKILPTIAEHYRVVAFDPPGLGASGPSVTGYDTAAIGTHVDPLLDAFGIGGCRLVCHDIGTWIGYTYAVRDASRLSHLVLMDAAIPGLTPADAYAFAPERLRKTWHFAFNALPELPEALIVGRERVFLEWLFRDKCYDWRQAFSPAAIEEYVRLYSAPGAWSNGLGYYRAIFDSMAQNRATAATPLKIPVLAVGGALGLGEAMGRGLAGAAPDLRSVVIPDCGHYVPEEAPGPLLEALLPFLAA